MEDLGINESKIKAGDVIVFAGGEAYLTFVAPENVFLVGFDGKSILEFYRDLQTVGELEYILDQEYGYYTVYSKQQYEIILKEKNKREGKFLHLTNSKELL